MEYLGTKFTITLGELRLRFVLALDAAEDDSSDRQMRTSPESADGSRAALR